MEHYEAKHRGLIPVIFVDCSVCGGRATFNLLRDRCVVCERN